MRILHLTDRRTARGGAHHHVAGVVESQVAEGLEVHLAAGDTVAALDAREAVAIDLQPLLDQVRPEIVHVHTVVNPVALEQAADAGAVITVQDHRYFCPGRGKWTRSGDVCRDAMSPSVCASCFDERAYFDDVLAVTARRLNALRRMRAVVVLSEYMKKELVPAGLDPARLHVIPPFVHGLDLEAAPDGPPCVLFVGRLVEHKGVRDALAAWRQSELDLPLVMAGTGPLRDEMAAAGVQVLGWLDRPALSRAYARARALLMPSRWQEPFGIAGLEAAAMGVPVVAWESGGICEWHPGPLGAWGDVQWLAENLGEAVRGRATTPRVLTREAAMARLAAVYRGLSG